MPALGNFMHSDSTNSLASAYSKPKMEDGQVGQPCSLIGFSSDEENTSSVRSESTPSKSSVEGTPL